MIHGYRGIVGVMNLYHLVKVGATDDHLFCQACLLLVCKIFKNLRTGFYEQMGLNDIWWM
jgi:hypothetical protein